MLDQDMRPDKITCLRKSDVNLELEVTGGADART
jgi:hypothetical protein